MNCHACGTRPPTARFSTSAARNYAATSHRLAGGIWAPPAGGGRLIAGSGCGSPGKLGGGGSGGEHAFLGDGPAMGRPPDISRMSPEERATRLYNRVMTLHAAGKTDSAEFFLPMALQAYQMIPTLDVDAHYHLGVLYLTGGDGVSALAEADSIGRMAATHLFAFVLRS